MAQALGHCAIRQGVDVLFSSCSQLTATLNAARAAGGYERKLATLARVPLLVIDDFGLKPLRPPADEDLHDLIAERYEQASTIVTSNLDFDEWDQAFPNNRLLASATVGRLRLLHGTRRTLRTQPQSRSGRPQIDSCRHCKNRPFLTLQGCPFSTPKTGFITPIIPGSFMPIGDRRYGPNRQRPGARCSGDLSRLIG